MAENSRFSEYTTSGAFSLGLTRNQVSSLALLADGATPDWTSSVMAALERKGLAERVPAPTDYNADKIEFRATHAGLLTFALCREAGLTNYAGDPVAEELARLREELVAARHEAAEANLTARSALARLAEVEHDLENARAAARDDKLRVRVLPRDPLPELSVTDLARRHAEPFPANGIRPA